MQPSKPGISGACPQAAALLPCFKKQRAAKAARRGCPPAADFAALPLRDGQPAATPSVLEETALTMTVNPSVQHSAPQVSGKYKTAFRPPVEGCSCYTCRTHRCCRLRAARRREGARNQGGHAWQLGGSQLRLHCLGRSVRQRGAPARPCCPARPWDAGARQPLFPPCPPAAAWPICTIWSKPMSLWLPPCWPSTTSIT